MNTIQNLMLCCMYASLLLAASMSVCQLSQEETPQEMIQKMEAEETTPAYTFPGGDPAPPADASYREALMQQELKKLQESGAK